MGDIAVIYQSKYGTTKQYATWIAEELSADLFEATSFRKELFSQYQTIIFGGGLYAGGIGGISLITRNFDLCKDKHLIVFTCGLGDPTNPAAMKVIRGGLHKTFSAEMREKIKFFHFRGGVNYQKLSFLHKMMMGMLKFIITRTKPEQRTKEQQQLLAAYGETVDFTDQQTIAPLVSFVKTLS